MSNVIYRGETSTLNFNGLLLDPKTYTAGYITINQICKTVIDKPLADWELGAESVSVKLSQAETLSMTAGVPTTVQLRIRIGDDAYVSAKSPIEVKDVNKDGEI